VQPPRFIVVTGGVYSGLGKGIVTASMSALLARKHRVVNVKWDGYYNNNPGTMNPIEHGEVFVLADGTEADLDFGHYERFTGIPSCGMQSITRGKLNELAMRLEKEGKRYEGKTIEEIPHLRDLLIEQLTSAGEKADIITFEIGGNVGDDSASLALHAARILQHRFGRENVMYVHVAPMCYTIDDHEPKTRPIQRSLSELTGYGIEVDMLVVRTEAGQPLKDEQRRKISESSILPPDAIIEAPSLSSVYALPIEFLKQNVDGIIVRTLGISVPGVSDVWMQRVRNIIDSKGVVRVALCGKYTDVNDSYKSVKEALTHAGASLGVRVELYLFNTERDDIESQLAQFDAVIVPGGYGSRGIEGKIKVIKAAREQRIPYLGLCYGMQLAVVEFARSMCGLSKAHTVEVDPATPHPVISLLPEQAGVRVRSGTQRLGEQEASLLPGSIVERLYGAVKVSERHRHRYELNPEYHDLIQRRGMLISGVHAEREDIAEFVELSEDMHPFFVATQSHPELKSTLLRPAPLFIGLVKAALAKMTHKA
jgi:CTP synthase